MEIETQEVNTLIAVIENTRSTIRFIVSQSARRLTRSRHHYIIDPVAPRHDPARGRKLTPSRGLSALVGVPIDVGHTSKSEEKTAELSTGLDESDTNEYFRFIFRDHCSRSRPFLGPSVSKITQGSAS